MYKVVIMAGKLICMEGIDGAGISTQATKLKEFMNKTTPGCHFTKEPSNNITGGLIRSCLKKEWRVSPATLQILFAADRSHHLETEIEPVLKKGKHVLCDRYILSSLVYGTIDNVPLQYLKQLNAPFRRPDITFIIDTHPRIAMERIKKSRFHMELFETEQKLSQVRQNYLQMKNFFPGTHVIDGNKTINEVFEQIKNVITKKL